MRHKKKRVLHRIGIYMVRNNNVTDVHTVFSHCTGSVP